MKYKAENVVGKTYTSNNFGEFTIIDYKDSRNVVIEFINTKFVTTAKMSNVIKGAVKDKSVPTVLGVGFVGEKYKTWVDGKALKQYVIWKGVLERCFDKRFHKKQPTYAGCTISENFKHYERFYEWCANQKGSDREDFFLDKDLLVKGNKEYSENVCVFVSKEINNFLTLRGNHRGAYPLGVSKKAGRCEYYSQISIDKELKFLGKFETPEQAFYVYKQAKEQQAKDLAEKWKGSIDARAYNALLNYTVNIED